MRIAFDAKRAFYNNTGLGQYSRNLLNALIEGHPQHEYYLATPGKGSQYLPPEVPNVHTITPNGLYKNLTSLWRSIGVKQDLKKLDIDLYHGLSHEIPLGIRGTGIRTVVTMHDLIFERYPEQYKKTDVAIYRRKFRYAGKNADKVIAISKQTADDLMLYYNVPSEKIVVCYQSCNPAFRLQVSDSAKSIIREKYNLPSEYLLSVGTIIERKNLLTVCKAVNELKDKVDLPLVVIGKGNNIYRKKVDEYIASNGLAGRVIFLSEREGNVASDDMPALYQMASCMLYTSIFEGFGIPILEAMSAGVPVITSNVSCMPETGGAAALYIDPYNEKEMASAISQVISDEALRKQMIQKGFTQAANFSPENAASCVMEVYKSLVH